VIRGSEIEQSTNEVLKSCRVFAEVDPIQKSLLVERLRALGLVVGFLGDGINDAPALRAADVAISVDDAMDVAKSASSIVLLEKNLSVIADGVRIGRRTFENTMKYVRITMSASFGNVLSMAIASFFLPFLPMLPTQILLLNFLSDLPALAISSDRVDDEDLAGARHWTMRGIGHFMVLFGMISTAFDLMLFFMVISLFEGSEREIRSSWFALSLITEVIAILVLRTRRRSWQSPPSKTLGALALLAVLIALSVPYLGLLQPVELPRIGAEYSALVISIALGYLATSEFAKLRSRLVG
jgi:Mg2+-importing ATPase